MDDLAAVASARPDLSEGTTALGEMRLEASNAQDARPPLEAAAKYAPNDPVVHNDLGDCYRLLGRAVDAKREFDTALSQRSNFPAVHYNLGLLYLYGSNVPGVSSPADQVQKAINEFSTYKTMLGPNPPRGGGEDVDALLSTAKDKLSAIAPPQQPANDGGA
jgi:Tfp pilus assembly protein PilF